jgi:hypothetical protein
VPPRHQATLARTSFASDSKVCTGLSHDVDLGCLHLVTVFSNYAHPQDTPGCTLPRLLQYCCPCLFWLAKHNQKSMFLASVASAAKLQRHLDSMWFDRQATKFACSDAQHSETTSCSVCISCGHYHNSNLAYKHLLLIACTGVLNLHPVASCMLVPLFDVWCTCAWVARQGLLLL